jgi:TetR/AcrR family transcriptional regulator, regulator of biofilm formation and stress response
MVAEIADGRRRKGERRRRLLIDATMRVIERSGVSAVSQRTVAQEAGVPPSAVTYYFPAVDDLLVAALVACNDACLRDLNECARADDPLARLAALIADVHVANRARTAAEYELFLMAGRRPDLQREAERWTAALEAFLAPHVPDPVRRAGVAAAVDGLFLRSFCAPSPPDPSELRAVLDRLAHG